MSLTLIKSVEKLKKMVLSLSAQVEERVQKAILALESGDADLASEVMSTDSLINELDISIEEECYRILALQHPVAIDLRFVNAVIKINKDLERTGDLAVEIATHVRALLRNPGADGKSELSAITKAVRDILETSLNALADLDTDLAFDAREARDNICNLNGIVQNRIGEALLTHPELSEQLMHIAKISDTLERIARLAENIAEEIIYIVDGLIIRHDQYPGHGGKRDRKKLRLVNFVIV